MQLKFLLLLLLPLAVLLSDLLLVLLLSGSRGNDRDVKDHSRTFVHPLDNSTLLQSFLSQKNIVPRWREARKKKSNGTLTYP